MINSKAAAGKNMLKYPSLVEVVFEIKWQLASTAPTHRMGDTNIFFGSPHQFYDPNYIRVIAEVEKEFKKAGHNYKVLINEALPHIINFRYFPSENARFPILQIGQGIFAANTDASVYEWNAYKALILKGIKAISKLSPKIKPLQIELRYLNVFEPSYLTNKNNNSFDAFINNESMAKFNLPNFSFSNKLAKDNTGRLLSQYKVKAMPANTLFEIDIASASKMGPRAPLDSIQLISKIVTSNNGSEISTRGDLNKFAAKWLEDSRSVLSPFFREFISPELSKKLEIGV